MYPVGLDEYDAACHSVVGSNPILLELTIEQQMSFVFYDLSCLSAFP